LWPEAANLKVDTIEIASDKLTVTINGIQAVGHCPDCQGVSQRLNGHYYRRPADLPCVGYGVQLILRVPRFFCDNEGCSRRTFAAEFPGFLEPYARRTTRLVGQQRQVGFSVSAEAGSPLLQVLGMLTSPDTLIRLVRHAPEPERETPRGLGVDDWALRKGRTYGTILVDLEKQTVVDVLADRSAESLNKWLKEHPGVEIISRDRGAEFIQGATQGAPEAIQIADRFHLLQNLVDVLKRVLEKQAQPLRQAAHQVAADIEQEVNQALAETVVETEVVENELPSLQELRFAEVKTLQQQGLSQRAIAQQLQLNRRTVSKYFELERCPQRAARPQGTSTVTPYLAYLCRRWQEGCHNIQQLAMELQAQGFEGHYVSVYRAMKKLLKDGQLTQPLKPEVVTIPRLSVSQAAWLLVHPDDRLDELQLKLRDKLCQVSDKIRTARELSQSFGQLVRDRQTDQLDSWLEKAEQSGLKAFKNFAKGLRRDYQAVKAALTYEWSNGQVEGQVNRLKFIKRQGYGRAKFDLLRKRVLGPSVLA